MELMSELKSQGINISLVGGRLKVEPREKITPELITKIKTHKQDIARELQESNPCPPNGSFYLIDGQIKPVPTEDIPLIQKLPYGLLKTLPATALYIYSRVLNDHIWLITNPVLTERLQATGKAVYMLEEIARLFEQNLTDPESIKSLHMVKHGIPGSYIQ